MPFLFSLLLIPAFQVLIAILTVIPTWLLWNWIAHGVLGLPPLTLLQTLGLQILTAFLISRTKISYGQ